MKKLIFILVVCFGVFMCQNVAAQNQPASLPSAQQASPQNVQLVNPQNTSFDKQVSTPGVGATPILLVNTSNAEFDKMTKSEAKTTVNVGVLNSSSVNGREVLIGAEILHRKSSTSTGNLSTNPKN